MGVEIERLDIVNHSSLGQVLNPFPGTTDFRMALSNDGKAIAYVLFDPSINQVALVKTSDLGAIFGCRNFLLHIP